MGEGPVTRGPATPGSAGDDDHTVVLKNTEVIENTVVLDGGAVTVPRSADRAIPLPERPTDLGSPHAATDIAPQHPPTDVVRPRPPTGAAAQRVPTQAAYSHPPTEAAWAQPPAGEVMRYGPGVPEVSAAPAGQPGVLAEQIWRTGRPPVPPRRPRRLRRLAGSALTLILLAASGVVLYLRFHHSPFHVTGVAIARQARSGCTVDVTGRITTNGSAGTVSYQWLFQPSAQPQPLSQSVSAGRHALDVTIALDGSGHGTTTQTVTLQVLRPNLRSASSAVTVSC